MEIALLLDLWFNFVQLCFIVIRYMGATPGRNGAGILIDRSLKDGVVEVRSQGDRIILIRLVVGDSVLNVISALCPSGRP